MKRAIGYIRVSTAKQGKSGLGLEAQQQVLQRFADAEGIELVDILVEVESAKHDATKRPVLAQALAKPKRGKLPIVVAKLDRLSRDVHYISGLMQHRVPLRRPGRERAAPDRRAHQGRAAGRQGPWRGSGRAS
jgi:DNA invertase Pin-like site-specific DNA recombinase